MDWMGAMSALNGLSSDEEASASKDRKSRLRLVGAERGRTRLRPSEAQDPALNARDPECDLPWFAHLCTRNAMHRASEKAAAGEVSRPGAASRGWRG